MQRAKPRKDHPDYTDKPCFIGKVLVMFIKYSGKGSRCTYGNSFVNLLCLYKLNIIFGSTPTSHSYFIN